MSPRIREALVMTLAGPGLLLVSFLLLRHSARLQGSDVPEAERAIKAAMQAASGQKLCEHPACTKPAVRWRAVGGGMPRQWCDEHIDALKTSPLPGLLGLMLGLPGIAATLGAFAAWFNLARGQQDPVGGP